MHTTIAIDQEVLSTLAKLAKTYSQELGRVDSFVEAGLVAEGLLIMAGHPAHTEPQFDNVVALHTLPPEG